MGHERTFKPILHEGPLPGVKRKLKTLEIAMLKGRSRRRFQSVDASHAWEMPRSAKPKTKCKSTGTFDRAISRYVVPLIELRACDGSKLDAAACTAPIGVVVIRCVPKDVPV